MFAQLTRLIATAGLAWLTIAVAHYATNRAASVGERENNWQNLRNALKAGAQILVLRILLPVTAVIAFVERPSGSAAFASLLVLGFGAALALFVFFYGIYRAAMQSDSIWKAMAAASMGGGNRGLAALLLFASILYVGADAQANLNEAKASFLAIDMGNFVALLIAFPLLSSALARPLVGSSSTPWRRVTTNLRDARWDLIPILLGVLAVAVFGLFGPNSMIRALLDQVASETEGIRSFLLVYLAWLYVFATLPSPGEIKDALGEALLLAVIRLAIAAFVLALVSPHFGAPLMTLIRVPWVLAMAVLLVAPVSSFAPFIAAQAGAPREAEKKISHLLVASTLLFAVVSFLAAVVFLSNAV